MNHWQNKVVVITGGSQGLGLEMALHFSSIGSTVVILARDQQRLDQVTAANQSMTGFQTDVLDDASVTSTVRSIVQRFGKVDVWINNVGRSCRSEFGKTAIEDFRSMMEINFYSAVRCTLQVLPVLQKSSGTIVNIGSLAAKTGWRHMSPYSASKHALAAFSHQCRLEAPPNVGCLFVCTGPIQRADAGQRYRSQAENLDATAAAPGAGVKLSGICPKKLSAKIAAAVKRQKKELIVPAHARIVFGLLQLSPTLGDWILGKFGK